MSVSVTDGSIFTFIWKIENFDYCLEKKSQRFNSPEFEVSALNNSRWRMILFPRGHSDAFSVSCFLKVEGAHDITIDFALALLTIDGTLLKSHKVTNYCFKDNGGIYGLYNFVKREEIFRNRKIFLLDEALCVCCRIWKKNLKHSVEHEQWFARTRMEFEQKSFKWVIDNFESTLPNQSLNVFFPDFRCHLRFDLFLSNGNIKLDIQNINNTLKIYVKCKIAAIVHSSLTQEIVEDEYWFASVIDKQAWHFPTLLTKENIFEMKKESSWDGVLKLQCECIISTGVGYNRVERTEQGIPFIEMTQRIHTVVEATAKQVLEVKNPKCESSQCDTRTSQGTRSLIQNKLMSFNSSNSLQDDLQLVYQDKILCDFTLKSGKDVFQVHKMILSARSPVFRAMFESDMKESKTDEVEIEDVDANTLGRMLLFMYTDKTEQLKWECASKLYLVSDKYEILPLKKTCSNILKNTLCVSNVCEVLVLADMHHDCDLKQFAQNFILVHDKEILCSDSWNKFEAQNVQLALQTMKQIYLKKLDT